MGNYDDLKRNDPIIILMCQIQIKWNIENRTKCNIAYLRLLEWIQIVYSNCWEISSEKWSKMEETDGKGELNWYRTNIYRYYVYGGYELKFNRKRMWKRKYVLWTKVQDNQLEKFIIVRNWRLPSWMSSEIFKSCTKNLLKSHPIPFNELFTLSHCNNGSVM